MIVASPRPSGSAGPGTSIAPVITVLSLAPPGRGWAKAAVAMRAAEAVRDARSDLAGVMLLSPRDNVRHETPKHLSPFQIQRAKLAQAGSHALVALLDNCFAI